MLTECRLKSELLQVCKGCQAPRSLPTSLFLSPTCHRDRSLFIREHLPIQSTQQRYPRRNFTSSAYLNQDGVSGISQSNRPLPPSGSSSTSQSTSPLDSLKSGTSTPNLEVPGEGESLGDTTDRQQTPQSRRNSRIESLLDSYAARRKAQAEETASALASMAIPSAGPPVGLSVNAEFPDLPPLRLTPSLGRTIPIDLNRGVDIGRALGLLGMRLAKNRVRADMQAQKFHERPGLKRKRLRTERREKRFLRKYSEMKEKVLYMVRKGY
jgi:small subunit ribosomal protein MRP21